LERKDRSNNLINSKKQIELPTIPEFFPKKREFWRLTSTSTAKKHRFLKIPTKNIKIEKSAFIYHFQ